MLSHIFLVAVCDWNFVANEQGRRNGLRRTFAILSRHNSILPSLNTENPENLRKKVGPFVCMFSGPLKTSHSLLRELQVCTESLLREKSHQSGAVVLLPSLDQPAPLTTLEFGLLSASLASKQN